MKKLYKLLLICLLTLSGGMALKAQDKAYETPTLVNGYYEISKADHLFWFAEYVNTIDRTASAKLMNDIDLEGGYWSTICETSLYYNSYSNDYGYSGTFDGNGHVIKNFKVKSSTTADASAGLFGTVCGTIKNLGVENFTFEDGGNDIRAAAIVGQLITTGGKISNCYVKNATITPGEHVTGGIAGCVYDGTIENCYVVNSNINGSSGRYGYIVGDSRGDKSSTDRPGTVTNCYSDNTPLISDRKGNLSSVENKSAAQFASGEVAYLLQGEQQTDIWGQNIDNGETKETLPVLGGAKVYKIYNSGCTHYGEFIYSNDANAEFYHEHSFTEDSNGFCTLCNGYEAAELVDGVYHIGNLGQLMWFANNVNTAHKVLLTADITIDNSVVWKPIGLQDGASNSSVFNGDGHTITFDNTNEGSVFGLFGTYNYSIIENLYLAGSITCNTTDDVGALVNSAYRTTIRNVISYVEVTNIGSGRAGGLAGQFGGQHSGELYSLIENCAVYADVTGNVAGGIIGHGWSGYQYYDIKNVAYAGDVTGSERQAAVIAYHGNNSDATKCKFENIYYCEKDALGFVGGGNTNYDLGTDVAAMTAAQFASGEVAYLLQGEQATQIWGQNIDNGETVQQYPVFSDAKVHLISCGDVNIYSNTYVEHSFNENGFCNTCGNCEPAVFEDNYYLISNAGNLVWFSKHVNNDNFSANAKLMNDIEMNAVQWTPIGTSDAYNGTFDGQGHTINNLWHNTGVADGGREGLFTLIGSNGVVTNVTLNNATIWGSSPYGLNGTGGIAVRNEGCITNTMVTNSSIQQGAYEYLGGIAGWNKGSITNCAVINSTLTRRWGGANSGTMGGITQTNSGSVTNCYTYGCMFNNGNNLNSAIVAKENAAVNSYYYTTDNVADAAETAKTKEQFASGEVAYLLQGEQTTQIWGQNIDNGETVQTYPVISDAKVYKHTFNGVTLYSNHKTLKAGGKCGDNLYWYVDKNNALTIYGTGAMDDYDNSSNKAPWRNLNPTPKSLVLKEGITHIGDSAFSGCSGFTGSLTIPNSVTSIGEGAFSGCSSFTGDLTIGNSVKSIGDWAFADCRGFNGSLTIPNSVTAIGSSAFRDCSGFTGSLTIPNSVTAIGNDAFRNCSGFTGDLTIPNSITTIGNYAFYGCSGFNGSLTIPNSITTIGNSAFSSCSGFNGSLTIPNSVTTIGNYAFKNCSGFNGSLTIPNSVMTIGDYAFSGCSSFTEVYSLAETAPTLGTEAFPMFKDINPNTTLYYPTSGEQSYNAKGWFNYFSNRKAFNGKCGDNLYWYVDVNNTLTIFGTGAMYDYDNSDNKAPWRSLNPAPTSLVLEEGITHIGNSAFYDCEGFTEVYSFAVTVPTLGTDAFDKPNNATLYYPASSELSYNDNGWFEYFPQHIGFNGKCGDNLYWYVDDENTLTIFGTGAMYDYEFSGDNISPWKKLETAPTSLVLEEGITHIGNYAFSGCSSFTDVYSFAATAPTLGTDAFANINENATLYYPVSSYQSYDENGWFNYFPYEANGKCGDNLYWYVDDENTLTIFGTGAMYDYGSDNNKAPWRSLNPAPTSLVMEEGITHIGDYAFDGCSGFDGSLTIPNSVTTIGNSAFQNCSGFTEVYSLAETAPTLGTDAFANINENAILYYPASSYQSYDENGWFNYFPYEANGKCGDNLYWYVDENNTLTIFGTGAMYDYGDTSNRAPWRSLKPAPTSLVMEEGITHIGNFAFYYCKGFTGSLTIPNSVTTIGLSAFYDCSGFTGSLTIGNSVTTIGGYAFYNCKGFTEVYSLAETAPTLGENAFNKPNNATLYYPASSEPSYNNKGWFNYFSKCIGFNGKCGDNLYWYVDENNTLTIFGTGAMNNYNRDSNKAPWRSLTTAPTSLVLKEGITRIGDYAFYYCSGFNGSLTIPNSVTSIGNFAFSGCSGFNGSLTIGNSVTSIGDQAFSICEGFTGSLTIPNSVTSIGDYAFFDCYNFNGYLTIGNSVTTIGDCAFLICFGFTGSLTIPNSVTNIGVEAFQNCDGFNGSLTIGNSVTYIGDYAFSSCDGFTGSLTIGNSVRTIGDNAFRYCSGFTGSLTIPNSVTNIGDEAFQNCYGFNGSLTIGNSVTYIGDYAFSGCDGFTGSLTIGNSVRTIGDNAFRQCYGFSDVYSFAVTAPTLGTDAFDNPNNATLYYPASSEHSYNGNGWFEYFPQYIGFNGKCGDNLYWRVNDNILTIFGTGAMYDYGSDNNKAPWRSLNPAPTSLVLEEGITHIGNSAFCNCYGFKGSLTIPNSVTSIGNYAFYACFFTGSLTIPNSVTTIGNEAFRGCSGFTGSLTIPNSVTSIGDYAFYNCYGFTGDLTIGNSVRAIGDYAFWGCYGFTGSLTIPNSVTTIGNYAFQFCDGFTGSLTISNSVTTIGNSAFQECSGFTGSLTIPNSVTTIGNSAFQKCSGFTEIFFYRDANPTIATSTFSYINANAKVYAPVIWSSFAGIPSEKLVKMATFVGEQSADASTGSATINGWVGLAEDQTWPDEDDHVAINAPMVISSQQSAVSSQQSANSLSVKSFGLCGNENTTNGRITIEDGGQLYCEVARGKVTVKKEILGYQQSAVSGQQSESESKWYTIASPLKDTIQITTNSSFLTPNSDLYRYDEPSYTWQNAKNSANNGFNTIDPGRGYLYANAENTSLKFTGDINTETATYNLTAKSDVLKGFHLIGNPFTHDIYLGESIKTKGTQNIIFELNDSYGDGWNGAALNLSFSDGTPDKIITIESGNSKTETINVGSGVTVTVSFTKGSFPKECSFTIKYDDVEIICDKYSNEGSLTSVVDGETLTEFPVKEGKDILVNGYYTLTGEGAWTAEASTTEAIKPMQGILVKSLVDDSELKIYNTSRQPSAISRQQSRNSNQQSAISQQSLCISVSNAKYSDRAFVVFDKGVGLDKMNHENEDIPLLYIPMEDADYAIAMMDINVNEIPVNFETNVMGEYTISLRQENCEFDELYLLDKETDEKVNILEQDYTFIATSSENPERFILMKDAQGSQLEAHSHFAYINNDNIVIYNIEGDADIKIFDALGRCVYHGESSDETTRIANGYSSGVYMIQKVDDKGVKVQKVMID